MASIRERYRKIKIAPDISFRREDWIEKVTANGWVWSDEKGDWYITIDNTIYWGSELNKQEWEAFSAKYAEISSTQYSLEPKTKTYGPRGEVNRDLEVNQVQNTNQIETERPSVEELKLIPSLNPYTDLYNGKTDKERITYLKAAIRWLEVEIRRVRTTLDTDLRLLKRQLSNPDTREIQIITAAGSVMSATGGLSIPGAILLGISRLGNLVNNSPNSQKNALTEKVRSNTELLSKYLQDYNKLKIEYENLIKTNGLSSDADSNEKKSIYWIIGVVVVLGIVIYFLVRNK